MFQQLLLCQYLCTSIILKSRGKYLFANTQFYSHIYFNSFTQPWIRRTARRIKCNYLHSIWIVFNSDKASMLCGYHENIYIRFTKQFCEFIMEYEWVGKWPMVILHHVFVSDSLTLSPHRFANKLKLIVGTLLPHGLENIIIESDYKTELALTTINSTMIKSIEDYVNYQTPSYKVTFDDAIISFTCSTIFSMISELLK